MADLSPDLGMIEMARLQGLHLTASSTRLDETGADFRVMHATDEAGMEWIVRSPRRPDAFERSGAEKRILEMMRPRLAVAIPEWRVHLSKLIAYPRLAGEPAATIDMTAGGYVWRFDAAYPPGAFVRSLGQTLANIHATPAGEAVSAGIRCLTPSDVRRAVTERIARCQNVVSIPGIVSDRWEKWLQEGEFWPEHSVLVHGDLHPPHLLVASTGELIGVIDWSEAHIGDPATDFALFYATMGTEVLISILESYRAAGGRTWPRIVDHIVESWAAYPLTIADFALRTGEEGPLQLAQHLIDATAAEMGRS